MTSPTPRSPWWQPHVHADRRPFLLARGPHQGGLARLVRSGRTSSRSKARSCRSRPATRRICTPSPPSALRRTASARPLYLHTSPEFACKKLLAAGEERIFDFARVFRNRERGPLHHPEFTMLEWYRAGEPYEALMDDCAALLALAAETAGARDADLSRARTADPFAEPERLTVAEAFDRYAGIDLLATVDA